MTADTITAIKKTLEAAEQFIVNGVALGYIRMPDPQTPDSAHDTLPMIRLALSTLESLQRENERLQAEIDRKSSMPGDHRYWEGRYRDEAAENEKLRGVVERAQSIVSTSTYPNWHDTARQALASTGGEHHGN